MNPLAATDKELLGVALGRIPSGLFVVTVKSPSESDSPNKVGMLASWVQQAGFDPPTLMLALHPEREAYRMIAEHQHFTVHVLGTPHQDLLKRFSRFRPDAFDEISLAEDDTFLTLTDSLAWLYCRLTQTIAAADHHIAVATVLGGGMGDIAEKSPAEPMIHLRRSGFSY